MILALLALALGGNDKVAWEKPEMAAAKAQAAGKPAFYYFLVTQQTEAIKPPAD